MYYSDQNGYMQDLNFYNQINPNFQSINNKPFSNVPMQLSNSGCPCNNYNQMFNYNNQMPNNMNQTMQFNNNLENMYPCIYRILNPVIERVIDGSYARNQLINEDCLNNMVDTVFNITEGQLDKDDMMQNNSQNLGNDLKGTNTNINSQNRNTSNTNDRNEMMNNQREKDRNNSLIKDIIRILIIRSIISRNNRNFENMPNSFPFINQRQNIF